nr:hypothetical protein [Paenibacillus glacialis]
MLPTPTTIPPVPTETQNGLNLVGSVWPLGRKGRFGADTRVDALSITTPIIHLASGRESILPKSLKISSRGAGTLAAMSALL